MSKRTREVVSIAAAAMMGGLCLGYATAHLVFSWHPFTYLLIGVGFTGVVMGGIHAIYERERQP